MGALHILREGGAQRWQVWPVAEKIPAGSVAEATSYFFELADEPGANCAELRIDEAPLEALRSANSQCARWRWTPGFFAGTVDVELRLPGTAPAQFEVVTDPDIRKMTREMFDRMLREILQDTFALFGFSAHRKGVSRGSSGQTIATARIEFLRSRIEELEAVVNAIVRRPRRSLEPEIIEVPYYRAARASGREITQSLRSGPIYREQLQPGRLPTQLRGLLPKSIRIRRTQNSFNIEENRQIAANLRRWGAFLGSAADRLAGSPSPEDATRSATSRYWASRCRRLATRIGSLAAKEPFLDLDPPRGPLVLTPIFKRDPNYRRFYALATDIELGIANVFGEFLNVPLSRTDRLYELWCYTRLMAAAVKKFNATSLDLGQLFSVDDSGRVTIAATNRSVPVGQNWRFSFQRNFKEYWESDDKRGSFSRDMRPDISAWKNSDVPSNLIVLDAKYRLHEKLNDAIGSIHTYRDALVAESEGSSTTRIVRAAYILSPALKGANLAFPGPFSETEMPARLFHPKYRSQFRFGAVLLKPGASDQQFEDLLDLMVEDASSE